MRPMNRKGLARFAEPGRPSKGRRWPPWERRHLFLTESEAREQLAREAREEERRQRGDDDR